MGERKDPYAKPYEPDVSPSAEDVHAAKLILSGSIGPALELTSTAAVETALESIREQLPQMAAAVEAVKAARRAGRVD